MFTIFSLREFCGFDMHVESISIKLAETEELRVFNPGVAIINMAAAIADNLITELA